MEAVRESVSIYLKLVDRQVFRQQLHCSYEVIFLASFGEADKRRRVGGLIFVFFSLCVRVFFCLCISSDQYSLKLFCSLLLSMSDNIHYGW